MGQELLDKHDGSDSKFWYSVAKDSKPMSLVDWSKNKMERFATLMKELGCDHIDEPRIATKRKEEYAEYCKQYDQDLKDCTMMLKKISFKEVPGGFSGARKKIAQAEELMKFLEKGGAIPKDFQEAFMGGRGLLPNWKAQISKNLFGFLVTKEKPGAVREAVYKVVAADEKCSKLSVAKLAGVKFQPNMLATSNGEGGWQLPLTGEAQKAFDLIKPGQMAATAMHIDSEIEKLVETLESPANQEPPAKLNHMRRSPFGFTPEEWEAVHAKPE